MTDNGSILETGLPEPAARQRPFPGLGQALLLLLLLQVLANTVAAMILLPVIVPDVVEHGTMTRSIPAGAVGIVANSLAFAVVAWLTWKLSRLTLAEAFPLRPVRAAVWPGVLLALAGGLALMNELSNWMLRLWPPPEFVADVFRQFLGEGKAGWSSLVFLVLVAPITEEFFFRGVLQNSFYRRYSRGAAVTGSAVLFGLVHLIPWQVVPAIGLGFLFAWWTERFESLWPALVAHAITNGTAFLTSYLQPAADPLAPTPQPPAVTLAGACALAAGTWWLHRLRRGEVLPADARERSTL